MLDCSPSVRKDVGSNPGRFRPKTWKLVLVSILLSTQHKNIAKMYAQYLRAYCSDAESDKKKIMDIPTKTTTNNSVKGPYLTQKYMIHPLF